jgi:hypothetical protein
MPKNKDLKKLIRNRAEKTGESYATARSNIVGTETAPKGIQVRLFTTRHVDGHRPIWARTSYDKGSWFLLGDEGDSILCVEKPKVLLIPTFRLTSNSLSVDRNRANIIREIYDRLLILIGTAAANSGDPDACFILRLFVSTDLTHLSGESFCNIGMALIQTDPSWQGASKLVDEPSEVFRFLPRVITDDIMLTIGALIGQENNSSQGVPGLPCRIIEASVTRDVERKGPDSTTPIHGSERAFLTLQLLNGMTLQAEVHPDTEFTEDLLAPATIIGYNDYSGRPCLQRNRVMSWRATLSLRLPNDEVIEAAIAPELYRSLGLDTQIVQA